MDANPFIGLTQITRKSRGGKITSTSGATLSITETTGENQRTSLTFRLGLHQKFFKIQNLEMVQNRDYTVDLFIGEKHIGLKIIEGCFGSLGLNKQGNGGAYAVALKSADFSEVPYIGPRKLTSLSEPKVLAPGCFLFDI